ncbi:translational activator of GCN4 [Paraconiothyrium brasiliense]|uniref:Translational activator of GCN4 n=1 Tax=Paraconiothyrium brasiliense TaxID=300254 RepID=A0ABR3QYT2_9PLEO
MAAIVRNTLHDDASADCFAALVPPDLKILLELLFETYPLYDDRDSRRAVDQVLRSLIGSTHGNLVLSAVVDFLKKESQKKSLALSNVTVLIDWCSVLLQHFANAPDQWAKHGLDVALALARVLELCMGVEYRKRGERIHHSALVSTRRALRPLFRAKDVGEDALDNLVTTLTAKGASSAAGNAVLLGAIAGVSSRLPTVKPLLETRKQQYYTFYVREIVGSRTQLPDHISHAFHDFFESFTTLEELRKEVIPPIEKALLRAPEVVLNDIVTPMVLALPKDMDLSDVLLGNLLKPLLSNVKSTNPGIRAGALRTFKALAARSHNESAIGKVTDEILNPLKQGKISGVDQKVLHAQMLSALPQSAASSQKIPVAIAPAALKEPNEAAVVAEVGALTKHLKFGLANGVVMEKSISDAFIKGMTDKRVPIRRLWALRTADLLWDLTPQQLEQKDVISFYQASLPKLVEIWQEVNANPVPATQSGLVTVGHYVTALLASRVQFSGDATLSGIYKKSDVVAQSLAIKPKPSFLLNPRVYSKLNTEDDVEIALRALTAVSPWLLEDRTPIEAREAWAHAFIFFIVAQGVSTKAKVTAKVALEKAYVQAPSNISSVIVAGLWSWYKSNESGDKESAAVASKSGVSELYNVLGSICLSQEFVKKHGASIDAENLREQSVSLLLLARPELMPRVSWIDLSLRMGVDPGRLVQDKLPECVELINNATMVGDTNGSFIAELTRVQDQENNSFPSIVQAAYSAYTDLVFVAPDVALPVIVNQFSGDLDSRQLESIGPTEAAIFRTPEGTAYIDVLSKKAPITIDKNTKDYDTLKWEEELRAQLAQKTGQTKKLTADEQAKVKSQLTKEAAIRKEVAAIERKMRRGVGIIRSLATGPPTEAEQWMGPAVNFLIQAIRAGAGLILGDLPATAYIKLSEQASSRLGPFRPFVGIATLRTIGSIHLPAEYEAENLGGKSHAPVT